MCSWVIGSGFDSVEELVHREFANGFEVDIDRCWARGEVVQVGFLIIAADQGRLVEGDAFVE